MLLVSVRLDAKHEQEIGQKDYFEGTKNKMKDSVLHWSESSSGF